MDLYVSVRATNCVLFRSSHHVCPTSYSMAPKQKTGWLKTGWFVCVRVGGGGGFPKGILTQMFLLSVHPRALWKSGVWRRISKGNFDADVSTCRSSSQSALKKQHLLARTPTCMCHFRLVQGTDTFHISSSWHQYALQDLYCYTLARWPWAAFLSLLGMWLYVTSMCIEYHSMCIEYHI